MLAILQGKLGEEDVGVPEVGAGLPLQEGETHLCDSQTLLESAGCGVAEMVDHF